MPLPASTLPNRCFLFLSFVIGMVIANSLGCSGGGDPADEHHAKSKPELKTEREQAPSLASSQDTSPIPSTDVELPVQGLAKASSSPRLSSFLKSVFEGELDATREHLNQHPEDVNSSNADSRTALMLASFNGHHAIVELLLKAGANVDLSDEGGRTALMYASTGSNVEIVKMLLNHSAQVNAVDKIESWTPLMFASSEGKVRIVQLLLEHGADRNAKDVDGEDCLKFAKSKGHADVVWLLKNFEAKASQ